MTPKAVAFLAVMAANAAANSAPHEATAVPQYQQSNPWYEDGVNHLKRKPALPTAVAKNIILFVGDGMGVSTVTAARILAGQLAGQSGEEYNLSFDLLPYTGLVKTYNVDAQTPDSAGTMTAIMSGVKTLAGVLGVDENVTRGDCASSIGHTVVSALELAEIAGKATGIVSTARVTHATPAATYAKSPERHWEGISGMPKKAINAGCVDIAAQLIGFESALQARYPSATTINGIEVVMGGGRQHFFPTPSVLNRFGIVRSGRGLRTDGRNLVAEWQAHYPQGQYLSDRAGFEALDTESTQRVLALFSASHMRYDADRGQGKDAEPTLSAMTHTAINILNNQPAGYFLMVEGGRIDHGHHAGSAYHALTDTIAFAKAVQTALDLVNLEDTLILVTADHSHVLTISGYPKRGNPILGKVVSVGSKYPALALDGLPYTTLHYANGRHASTSDTPGRVDLSQVDTEKPSYHQSVQIPLYAETHGGEDVVIYGQGPGAHWASGTQEQNSIFHLMNAAAKLVEKANKTLNRP